jgi:hypothetical protein
MVDDTARDQAIYRALKPADEVAAARQTHLIEEHGADPDRDGGTYEIDHLGIGSRGQWGEFAVYRDGEEVAEFTLAESVLRSGSRPAGRPVSADELVQLARQELSG